eukprot:1447279-Pleurochrysis_carterae.AAC.2
MDPRSRLQVMNFTQRNDRKNRTIVLANLSTRTGKYKLIATKTGNDREPTSNQARLIAAYFNAKSRNSNIKAVQATKNATGKYWGAGVFRRNSNTFYRGTNGNEMLVLNNTSPSTSPTSNDSYPFGYV